MFARVENGVTKNSPKSKKSQHFGSETTVFNANANAGKLSFCWPRKPPFFGGGGGMISELASQ